MSNRTVKMVAGRNYPDAGSLGNDVQSLAQNVQAISDALDIAQRNTKNIGDSFVRVTDLIGLGYATLQGRNLIASTQSGGSSLTSPLTTKGDIWVYSTVDTRLPVGSNGYVLSADSTQATGLKWVAATTGTVTSVGVSSTDLSVSGSPITASGSITLNIANSAVTNAKMANMAASTVKGNVTGSPAAPTDLSTTQLTTLINAFTSLLSGAVPASGGGTTNFLRADGTWAAAGGTSPLTTKGDIWVYSSADTRLPVGSNGQLLSADSTQTTGLKWIAAPSTPVVSRGATWVASSGAVVAPGPYVDVVIPKNCTLTQVDIVTQGGTGSCTIDIWKAAIGSFPPVVGNTICGGTPPAIASALTYSNSTLSGWTTAFSAGDVLRFKLTASTTFTVVSIQLRMQE